MKLIIFGATGSIGRHLVQQALAMDHQVTAFARNPSVLDITQANLRRVPGDVLDSKAVEDAIEGQEVVLCALGAGRHGGVRSQGTRNIIRAMQATGVRRLICQTTLGVGESRGNLNFFWKYIMFGLLLRPAFADHVRQEEYVRASTVDWIIVRPSAFTDGPRSGRYRHGFAPSAKDLKLNIARADVADFMLRQLNDETYLHKTPGVSD